jgi:hypothetical protein
MTHPEIILERGTIVMNKHLTAEEMHQLDKALAVGVVGGTVGTAVVVNSLINMAPVPFVMKALATITLDYVIVSNGAKVAKELWNKKGFVEGLAHNMKKNIQKVAANIDNIVDEFQQQQSPEDGFSM